MLCRLYERHSGDNPRGAALFCLTRVEETNSQIHSETDRSEGRHRLQDVEAG